jgi:serine/threonine protein phosphatase PrpC
MIMVEEPDMELVLNSASSAKSACGSLVDLALSNGGRDNITVIVARYSIPPWEPSTICSHLLT